MTTKTAAKTAAPAADKAAPAAAPVFEDAAVPTVTRESKPNLYTEPVKALAADTDDEGRSKVAKAVTVAGGEKAVAEAIRLMQKAGKDAGVTVRNKKDDAGNGAVRITFWTVKRITRPRKAKETASA